MITNILEYLENSTQKFPEKIAYDDGNSSITYTQLKEISRKIGTSLSEYQRQPIILFMEKSVELIASMMGVITSGNFYTIIDTKMPKDRIEMIIKTLNPVAMITNKKLYEKAETIEFKNIKIYEELLKTSINDKILEGIKAQIIDTDPIYSLFTSGSTGVPKGYIINHRSVIDFCEAMTKTFHLSSEDIYANQSPLYFDLSIADIYCNIKNGSTVHLIPQNLFMFPVKVIDFLNEHHINFIFWVPSALVLTSQALEKVQPKYLKKVLFCGEAMPNKQLNIWRKHVKNVTYANLYGPAETVDASTYYIVNREFDDSDPLPIGKPFPNTRVIILDENNKEIKDKDKIGELCIAGSSLAMGYFNNQEKTKEAFIQNPLNNNYLEMIYKTGDLVKYNEFDELIYVSRKDYQIKHMGYRIELGEIENAISAIKEIEQNACIYDHNKKRIMMYYEGKELETKEILNILKNKLPNYMIPAKIIHVEKLPHNANGKIDRKKLMEMLGE